MKYGHDYFHKELLLLQNLWYEDYRDKTELDVLIDKLNTEEIYAYYDVEWRDFSSQFINSESDWDSDRQFPCEIIVEDDKLEHVCSQIMDRGVKIKLLLFFQKNLQSVWIGYCNTAYIEKECARLISKNIRESVRDQSPLTGTGSVDPPNSIILSTTSSIVILYPVNGPQSSYHKRS